MKVAIYVVAKSAKQTYAVESHDNRKWPGLAVIKDALSRSGIEVGYCGVLDAHEHDVVLVSITSGCDWWPFIAERIRWKPGKQRVIVGGAGVLNIRPFLAYADAFVFGRAEAFIVDLVACAASGEEMAHESVAWSSSFSPSRRYRVAQGPCYPHRVALENGAHWQEAVVGCQNKCLFCAYTWQRKHVGGLHSGGTADGLLGSALEKTLLELDLDRPETWEGKSNKLRIVAVDGFSERLRKSVNKPISRARLRGFFLGLAKIGPPHQIKMYNLVGLPGETQDDWRELKDDLATVDAALHPGKQWSIVLHNTPFRAMPATPSAHWPMSYHNYRGEIARRLREPSHKGSIFYQGNRFWAVEGMGTDSLATHILDAVCLRGTELDGKSVAKIASAKAFWSADTATRIVTLEQHFDVRTLFSALQKHHTPTEYLRSWWQP